MVLIYTMELRVSPSALFQRERRTEGEGTEHNVGRNLLGWGKKNEHLAPWLPSRGTQHQNHWRACDNRLLDPTLNASVGPGGGIHEYASVTCPPRRH